VLAEELTFPKNLLLSSEIKGLMSSLLLKNPKLRLGSLLGVREILAHPWFGKIKKENILRKRLTPPIKIDCPENLTFDFSSHRESELEVREILESQLHPENQKFKSMFPPSFYYERTELMDRPASKALEI
jgi:serum/glucocorticoid-regulated kinase 2